MLSLVIITGCSSGPSEPTADYRSKFEKRVKADEPKARAFVRALASVSPPERANYVIQRPDEARNLARIPDQSLQKDYRDLMVKGK